MSGHGELDMEVIPIIGTFALIVLSLCTAAFWLTGGTVAWDWVQVLAVAWAGVLPFLVVAGLLIWADS